MENCIFCKIISREIPGTIVYENDTVIAFEDINKSAPVHVLVVPKQHFESVLDINQENKSIIGEIHLVINEVARKLGIDETGFRLINNCGKDAEQTVKHLHYHILGGRNLGVRII